MAWNDRLREAAYNAPSGIRIPFIYENVRLTRDKKTTAFEFPDVNGTLVQESGSTGRRYPLRCIFTGGDCDIEAEAFESALFETGVGVLEHPIYGTVDVVPFGTVTRRDDLKTAANQAIIEVTFFATIGVVYPTSQDDALSTILGSVADYVNVMAAVYGRTLRTISAVEQATLKNGFSAALTQMRSGLGVLTSSPVSVASEFNAILDSIESSIDVLITLPETLASQTAIGIQTPAKSDSDVVSKLDAYSALLSSITSAQDETANEFYTRDVYASTYVSGEILSVVNNQFATRTEAISAAEHILNEMDALTVWRDANIQALEVVDTGEAYQQLQESVAITAGFLVEISFTLKQEHSIILDRARTIIDLSAEIYGSIDDQLDFLIESNNLSGSEILELPKGREIVFYI